MKMGGYHLTYCANVHPGESWDEAFQQLKIHLPSIKRKVSPNEPFGVGLYLSDRASHEILGASKLRDFKKWLGKEHLYVFTMNGFPYGNFHGDIVKENVYKPDWASSERVEYTKRLFAILADLLPPGMEGGVSTSPVSYKYWFNGDDEREQMMKVSVMQFAEMAAFLEELSAKTQKHLHLDIEPEPDCFIENSDEVIDFFNKLADSGAGKTLIEKNIALCFDICHFSVEYEDPVDVLKKMMDHGIKIGKIQISSALKSQPGNTGDFKKFNEKRYLHQTVKRTAHGELKQFRDLDEAVLDETIADEWRTHFHVPLFIGNYGSLESTQDDVLKVINFLKKKQITKHLEVETYTWDVLPAGLKEDLGSSVVRELEWVKNNFNT